MERGDGSRTGGTRDGEPRVRGVGVGQGPLGVEAPPRIERTVAPFRRVEVGGGDVSCTRLPCPKAGGEVVGEQARRFDAHVVAVSVAAEDRGHDDEVAVALGHVRQDSLDRQRRHDHVIAQDVVELDGLCGRRDVVRRELARMAY